MEQIIKAKPKFNFTKCILIIFKRSIEIVQYFYEMAISLFDKSVRIAFTNFWSDLSPSFFIRPFITDNFFKYKIVKYYNPDIQFFSVFGDIKKLKNSKSHVKIFYTGENVNTISNTEYIGNCIDSVNLSLGFDYCDAANYIRFPIWLLYFFSHDNSKDDIKLILNNFKTQINKTKFCALVSRHDKSGLRTKMYNAISQLGNVDCPGKILHNDNTLHKVYNNDKLQYLQQYKFNICPENTSSDGYVTEKIFQSLYSGCIPIYSGWSKNPEPDIINPDIIMWYDEFDDENNKCMIEEIKKLHENDKLYRSFMAQPYFCDTAVDKIYEFLFLYNSKILYLMEKHIKKAAL